MYTHIMISKKKLNPAMTTVLLKNKLFFPPFCDWPNKESIFRNEIYSFIELFFLSSYLNLNLTDTTLETLRYVKKTFKVFLVIPLIVVTNIAKKQLFLTKQKFTLRQTVLYSCLNQFHVVSYFFFLVKESRKISLQCPVKHGKIEIIIYAIRC